MDENKDHINNRLGEQMPSHSPDPGTWQRLSAKLDAMDAETTYQERLQGLPVHSPDKGTWSIISSRLNRIAYYKTGIRIAVSVAAGLLLFFTVSRVSDNYQTKTNTSIPQHAMQEKLLIPSSATFQSSPVTKLIKLTQQTSKHTGNKKSVNTSDANVGGNQESVTTETEFKIVQSANKTNDKTLAIQEAFRVEEESTPVVLNNGNIVTLEVPVQSENNTDLVAQNRLTQDTTANSNENINTDTGPKSILFQKEQYPITAATSIKQFSPPEPVPTSNKNHVALDMNYLPENIYNGTNNSLFHNVDLTASYNKQKVRFNTSVGMAYNEEQLSFDMSYNINTPITAVGPGGKVDTLSYNTANMESEYLGTEKHKYITYNLGFGRRIFSTGKFSTWFNAGAGFGVQLNNPDLITSTSNSIKSQYNAQVVSVRSSKPVYNDVNVNFVTAIDFNYKILNKLSVTFTPTSRWYFKPVLSLNNQATDELTLGFRTGLKFDF